MKILPPNSAIKNDHYQYVPDKFLKVAESLEAQFLKHMLEQMESTTGAETKSTAENFYKDLQTTERSQLMAKISDKGSLKDMILNQIYPEQYRNEITYNALMRQNQNQNKSNYLNGKE